MSSKPAQQLVPYLEKLTDKQQIFVKCKLKGMSDVAAATAAGIADPRKNASRTKNSKAVQEALRAGMEVIAEDILFGRKEAHDMLMDAHRNAANTTEQVTAIREMIKLHGIAAPEVKEIKHSHDGRIEHAEVSLLTDEQLLKLANLPDAQSPEIIDAEFEEIEDAKDS